ncbi:MAG TPA: hypothetical protein VI451_11875 [Anaerolineales bacterium]|nr:hypothetical protein [Anaerolineales bacterium]
MENEAQDNWKVKTLLIGAGVGLLAGLGAAYMLVQRAEKDGGRPELSAGEGVKLGLLVLGLLRQVSQLGDGR